ncbi:MAG: UDP-N-acetylmuramoyl-L-alanyl-D-glutamate--2,6-diaminopimelate ligase [Bacteroidota bacterium]|nr:UDP-N-acetylmuramoyl-L-alanyl-D-glutamate--2,6-diaminopimelate ligase [Bacteroidota bacterium]MDX5430944.1 UDP-N-acetylmuramoyl-L-alanyl-D-glutamate--2,6-diaminopimelate ligase [Bacteroidota bacterium]MDX5469692.1 UDP-N-acetylmuramoyl-L-alanyl-D-glutamate--2,6-diaminopimelate ligase [Bacteroidota bacterium]
MKTLAQLIQEIQPLKGSRFDAKVEVKGITMDSRKAAPGFIFFAVQGSTVDGHSFIPQVLEAGVQIIVAETAPQAEGVHWIQVESSKEALGWMASAFYDYPSKKLKLVGVTGTNGKTTVATLLYELFMRLGYRTGLLSTVRNRIHDQVLSATHTTPDAVSLNALLADMVDAGCDYCFMESSSHAIDQRRIAGLDFDGAVFTNLTHDHLDYHGTFENYRDAKKLFFDQLGNEAFALVNKDDRNGLYMLQNTRATRYTYALNSMGDFRAKLLEQDFNGMLLKIGDTEAWYRLVGDFNAYNLLAVYGTAFLLGIKEEEIIHHLTQLGSVAGRIDAIRVAGIVGIVDYAHTPDALKNVLEVINAIRTRNEKLITVVGCGGDRDKAKRPIMAEIAARLSDQVIFTADNPRSEDPEVILNEMEEGVAPTHYKKTMRISDRKEAIKAAVRFANPGDIILVAGKGHETYQEIKGVKHPFDDKAILQETIEKLNN